MKRFSLFDFLLINRPLFPVRRTLLSLVIIGITLGFSVEARAQTTGNFTVLHSFGGGDNGFFPASPLIEGTDGNFYGTTQGGASTPSTIYQITPAGTLTTLHTFGTPSVIFRSSALTLGSDGNFYGTTVNDGANSHGTVFRIDLKGNFAVLHDFTPTEGFQGYGALLQSSDGNFYGTNFAGGANGDGTVYQLTPAGIFTVLVNFNRATDFYNPTSSLQQDSDGNFFCTASQGSQYGAFIRITPTGSLSLLYTIPAGSIYGADQASLAQGNDGDFYGSTSALFNYDKSAYTSFGTVFQVNPFGTFRTLYTFKGSNDGTDPIGQLVQGRDGNVYGTTQGAVLAGGNHTAGTAYQITTDGVFTLLHTFAANDGEGANGLVQGSDGSFYGTSAFGGANNGGTIYRLAVTSFPTFFNGQVSLGDGVYYLTFPEGNYFGYYSFLSDAHYIYHFDLGYEYVFDAVDGSGGVYFYDFVSKDFFYTSPAFPFPYLYSFGLNTVLYYYPDSSDTGHYTSQPRYFYNFSAREVITY